MKTIDVRGLSCPEPVLQVKQALTSNSELTVLANEAHTVTNITRFAQSQGKTVSVKEVGAEFELMIK
ncbi:sulfurtransferase TusA family protein [Clostridiaceae bacterium HFYG-1003]|nr:sulfurtransferase TusA family protein [Clostridiaceae bacterium HFYG-1003]